MLDAADVDILTKPDNSEQAPSPKPVNATPLLLKEPPKNIDPMEYLVYMLASYITEKHSKQVEITSNGTNRQIYISYLPTVSPQVQQAIERKVQDDINKFRAENKKVFFTTTTREKGRTVITIINRDHNSTPLLQSPPAR